MKNSLSDAACRMSRFVVIGLSLVGGVIAPAVAQDGSLDPNRDYLAERSSPVTYDVDFSIVVTAPYKAKKLAVWIPVPPSNQGQEVSDLHWSTFPVKVEPRIEAEKKFGNRFAYFEYDSPVGGQIIRTQFRITLWELRWNLDSQKVQSVAHWPDAFENYRRGDTQAVIVDGRFSELTKEIVPEPKNTATDMAAIMQWVEDHFEYDHGDASLRADAEHGLLKRHGHCSDYHSFCASLGRTLGVPTRVTYGINAFAKNSPSHCKLEAFLEPYGWVSFDVSETQNLINAIRTASDLDSARRDELAAAALWRMFAGFRDNTWYLQTRGTDYDLAPPATAGRVPVVRTAYIEADGVPLPELDPADMKRTAFSWMCVADFKPDHPVIYPFKDWSKLVEPSKEQ